MATIEQTEIDLESRTDSSQSIFKTSRLNHSNNDLDQAYWYMRQSVVAYVDQEASSRALKALRGKIDWRIVPICFACYTMQFIDKTLLNVRDSLRIFPVPLLTAPSMLQ